MPRVDEVGLLTMMFIGEEARPDALEVCDAPPPGLRIHGGKHRRRDVHRYHSPAERCGGQSEDAGAGPQIDERADLVEAEFAQPLYIGAGIIAGLALVAGDVRVIEVLGTRMGEFIEKPGRNE